MKCKAHDMDRTALTRRYFMVGAGALALGGCAPTAPPQPRMAELPLYRASYGPLPNEEFPLPAPDLSKIDPIYHRQLVPYVSPEPSGTIIVDTNSYFLYLTRPDGMAIRYGVGLGREGFGWNGRAEILEKRTWPKWFPPKEMIEREPELAKYSEENGGHPPGPANPLGARALYLFQDGKDTLYRLHGTADEASIGRSVSSGCVRLLNHDIIDLYDRVPIGTVVVVRQPSQPDVAQGAAPPPELFW
jgi:lipoprotein-anchoring transpeptidase ErfK/SrfK